MTQNLRSLLLYGGMTKQEFDGILPDIHDQNRASLKTYCIIVITLLGCAALAVLITSSFNTSTALSYLLGVAFAVLLLILNAAVGQRTNLLKYLFAYLIYCCAIAVTLAQPESLAVAYMVILVLVPLLFAGRPIDSAILTVPAVVAFEICEVAFKQPQLVSVDTWNAVIYGILGIIIGIVIQRMRLGSLAQLQKIAQLSETDVLTSLKNRNSFEQDQIKYSTNSSNIICVYADVNGLHELNNTQGHKAGDVMLQTVAREIKKQFGSSQTYRIGGDEFVAFAFGQATQQAEEKVALIDAACRAEGYHVSFGCAAARETDGDMDALLRKAEERMYAAKRDYYSQQGHDRRRR